MRGLGVVGFGTTLPDPVAVALAAITQLGDVWFLAVVLTGVYWFGDRERGAWLIAIALGGTALTVGLKSTFAFSRPTVGPPVPPEALPTYLGSAYALAVEADGYGFPSGHAVSSTVVWGGLAYALSIWTRRQRWLVAAALVVVVALSRVLLGVHFVVDVVAGVLVGGAYLGIALVAGERLADHDIDRVTVTFVATTALAVVAILVGGGTDGLYTLGAAAGGLLGWTVADPPREGWSRTEAGLRKAAIACLAVAVVAMLGVVVPAVPVRTLAAGVGVAAIIAAPRLIQNFSRYRSSSQSVT